MRPFPALALTPVLMVTLAGAPCAAPMDFSGGPGPQFRPRHEGFYAALGAGIGTAQIRSNGVGSARETGPVVRLRTGWAVSPQFTVVLEGSAWRGEEDPGRSILGTVTAGGLYYPTRTLPLYFRFGAGPAVFDVAGTTATDLTDWNVGGVISVGYDVALGDTWAVTPALDVDLGGFNGYSSNVFALTLSLTRH